MVHCAKNSRYQIINLYWYWTNVLDQTGSIKLEFDQAFLWARVIKGISNARVYHIRPMARFGKVDDSGSIRIVFGASQLTRQTHSFCFLKYNFVSLQV